jgi:hypothetical protein
MSDLHDSDILEWSEQQANLLRRLAAGERVNDQLDWENLIDEIESVGSEQLHAVRSYIVQALLHDLKVQAWPLSREVPHWQAEARGFRGEARDRFAPSMARRIDVAKLYREAMRRMPESIDGVAPQSVPKTCPATLEELLAEPPDSP